MAAAVIFNKLLTLLALCALLLSSVALAQQTADVPYVPTPWNVVDAMLDIARVNADDNLIDLGSGDGRILIEAATKRGARGTGIELDPSLVSVSNQEARRQGVGGKASFVSGNLYNFDFSRASVLTMYLFPKVNLDLRPRILSQLKPGARVVSHDFDMGEWKPDQSREIAVPNKSYGAPVSQIHLWYVPADVAGKWRWQLTVGGRPRVYEARVNQRFQEVAVEARVDGGGAVAQNIKLQGDQLNFTLVREIDGQQITDEFSGRVEGDAVSGRVRIGGGESATLDWRATRFERGRVRNE